MPSKQVALDVAAFLDSGPARALARPRREDLRRIAEAFFAGCYDGVGKKPRLLEESDLVELAGGALAGAFGPRDALVPHVPAVLAALLDHLEEDQVVPHAFELRRGLAEAGERFLATVGRAEGALRRENRPVVHRAEKLGRNDPCFCGSGRKFKKCCGKPA